MPALAEHLPTVPSVRRWLAGVRQILADGCSVIVVLPTSLDTTGIWDALRLEIERIRGEWPGELDLTKVPRGGDVLASLAAAVGLQPPGGLEFESCLTDSGLPQVIALHGIERLDAGSRADWLGLVSRTAALSHRLAGHQRVPSFLCLVYGEAILGELPVADVRLTVEWWWAMPSVLEVRVLFRSVEDGADVCRQAWREHVLPSIAGGDIGLSEHLWDNGLFEDQVLLARRLCEHAEGRGWTAESLKTLGLEARLPERHLIRTQTRRMPPIHLRLLWAHGLVYETDEHGIEVSSAALVILGRHEELAHRMWRGQAGLLLPLLDAVRLHLCTVLAREHGPDWPASLGLPREEDERRAVQDDPFAAQLGYLLFLFRKASELRGETPLRLLTGQAWEIRNELAHYRPVHFTQFRRLWEQIGKLAPAAFAGR